MIGLLLVFFVVAGFACKTVVAFGGPPIFERAAWTFWLLASLIWAMGHGR